MVFALSTMQLTSDAFQEGGRIPTRHTGEGDDVSPALRWTGAPEGTRAFAVVCHDPDAPVVANGSYGFVHWVLYNVPASVTSLPEAVKEHTNGMTGFGKAGYGGPMPPPGHGTHRYYFWVLALGQDVRLEAGLTLAQLLTRIEPHVLGMNRLVGTYSRG
ncbi:MAG: YbhB/YbcL family Raf kinase inhibitor-like protein [Dehalococcoidia bacterium]|nr:YbhB/YbcL family Raf kinase inhibitor-like protein [Dehalococcoidia bacterium]